MNHQKLTKRLVESIQPEERSVAVWDSVVRGFHVKVLPSGRRSYYVYYRNAAGQQRRPKIGDHGILTAEQARSIAIETLGQVAAGKDPSAARQSARRRTTLEQFWERYLKDATPRWKPRTLAANTRLWKLHLSKRLGPFHLETISRQDVAKLHQALAKSPTEANRAVALLKAILNCAIDWGELETVNPAIRVKPYPEKRRETFLSPEQLRAVMTAIAEEEALGGRKAVRRIGEAVKGHRGGKGLKEGESRGLTPHAAGLFRLLIYTGARLGDILNAQWAFWDRDARALRLPDSKTGKKNVWLNALAIGELEKLWAIRRQERWVIEGLRPGNRLVNPQKAWQRVRAAAARKLSEEGAAEEAVKTMTETRIHDLRHSYASFAVGSGLPLYLVGKALGHAEARTTERYAHIAENPIRDAADVVGDTIAQILDGSSLRPISRN